MPSRLATTNRFIVGPGRFRAFTVAGFVMMEAGEIDTGPKAVEPGADMQRLFTGTEWDRPPTCERCGKPESECGCPPPVAEPVRLAPESQTARLRREKRAKGKLVTVVAGLGPASDDLAPPASPPQAPVWA